MPGGFFASGRNSKQKEDSSMKTSKTDQSYQGLLQERADLVAEAKAIHEKERADGEGWTQEEKDRDDAINGESGLLAQLNEHITRAARQRENERTVATENAQAQAPGDNSFEISSDGPIYTKPNTPSGGPYVSIGHQLQDIRLAAYNNPQGMAAAERLGQVAKFHEYEFRADSLGAGEAVDSEGGFLVQTTFSSEIMRKMHNVGGLISMVRRIPLDAGSNAIKLPMVDESSRADGSRMGGVQGYWVDEGIAPTASLGKFARLHLELHKVAALGYATSELLENVAAMSVFFTDAFAEELRFKVEDAIFEGDGAGKPQGITEANALISVAKETGQAADTIVHENLVKMWARLWARSRANAVWLINQDCEPQLDDLAKTIGTAGVEPSYVRYSESGVMSIKGRPVMNVEYASTIGDVDDIVLADMGAYLMIDNGGIDQAQSIHVRFTTDETAFRATYRVDGGLGWKEALTPFKGTNTQSPVITLAARA
jgi:HK97 family phage major capsid protein